MDYFILKAKICCVALVVVVSFLFLFLFFFKASVYSQRIKMQLSFRQGVLFLREDEQRKRRSAPRECRSVLPTSCGFRSVEE